MAGNGAAISCGEPPPPAESASPHNTGTELDETGGGEKSTEAEQCTCTASTTSLRSPQGEKSAKGALHRLLVLVRSLPSPVMYLATAVIGVMCAASVYQSYGNSPHSLKATELIESLEKRGYSGAHDARVRPQEYGSLDLLTKELKQELAEVWSQDLWFVSDSSMKCDTHVKDSTEGWFKGVKSCKSRVQYVVVFDAGSTGTRMHIFLFQCANGGLKLISEDFDKIKPGLSESVKHPAQGAASLQPMIDKAVMEVPADLQPTTPLIFKATGGFRLLDTAGAQRLLSKIRGTFASTNFQFRPQDINIMSAREEGLYAWTTINYLTGTLDGCLTTHAVLDLGGASMQLTYQPLNVAEFTGELETLDLMGTSYSVYTHSYLGLGLMAARRGMLYETGTDGNLTSDCLPADYSGVFTFVGKDYRIRGTTDSSRDSCWKHVGQFLDSSEHIWKPWDLVRNRHHQNVYLISYFYEALQWVGVIGNEAEKILTVHDFYYASYAACESPKANMPFLCQDLIYITRILGEGFMLWNIPLHVVREISARETSWSLGAALQELSGMYASFEGSGQ